MQDHGAELEYGDTRVVCSDGGVREGVSLGDGGNENGGWSWRASAKTTRRVMGCSSSEGMKTSAGAGWRCDGGLKARLGAEAGDGLSPAIEAAAEGDMYLHRAAWGGWRARERR